MNRFATRLNSFRGRGANRRTVPEAIRAVAAVPGISALELNYPQHFDLGREDALFAFAAECNLAVTALNLRFDDEAFAIGAFTNPHESIRRRAIEIAQDAVDLAERFRVPHVILWMGPDGFDYPFQVDFETLWGWEIDGFRQIAVRNPGITVSVEYKPSDPRRVSLIRSMSDSLLAAADVGLPNFGVTIDFCHSLMAGEQPAAAAAMAARAGRLFGVHLNDGYGVADDGLMVGSVHPWQTLELLWVLHQHKFGGAIYFDTFPERIDPAVECAENVRTVQWMQRTIATLPREEIARVQRAQDAAGSLRLLRSLVLGDADE